MGILRDLYDIAHDQTTLPDIDPSTVFDDEDGPVRARRAPVSYDSIAKQAKEGTAQFPVLATRSLSYDNIQMIAKACERNFASFLQVVFTMNQITNTDNPQDFVNQYHQNTNTNIKGAGDLIGLVFNAAEVPQEVINRLCIAFEMDSIPFDTQFELTSINEKFIPMNTRMMMSMEARGTFNPHQQVKEKLPEDLFVDNDAKKANELIPTLMHVRILKDMGPDSRYVDFVVGVKAMIHPIKSEDMIDHIVAQLQDRGKLFSFIRWTTGEISFFKDLVFNIDQAKKDVSEIHSGQASTWWRALKNIKTSRRFHKWTRTGPVLPNATILISMEEVDFIKANYDFDLTEDAVGERIINRFGLLQFIIVDASSELAYFMLDGETRYNIVTFKMLERQNGDADKQFKEILRAVNKLQ